MQDFWFDGGVKKDIQSETVEGTKGRSHGEEVSLLEGRVTLSGYKIQKRAMNNSF